jgi:glycosyltransferase involved in cell wall biosynthesis
MPYVIFQGIYSTKVRRRLTSLPGFFLNRLSLGAADHVFTNRRVDLDNLQRLVPARRLSYVAPGIYPEQFVFDAGARRRLRREWRVGDDPVVIAAAMFRPGVKARGIEWTIRSCGRLWRGGRPLHLVIAGDGIMRDRLTALAAGHLPGRVHFVGRIGRDRMAQIYSAGEVFAFPGFRESLGMVYLEAQSCGLPVVALANGGIPEVVSNGETGLLTPLAIPEAFDRALDRLLADSDLRRRMGAAARQRVRQVHDLNANYRPVLAVLERLASLGSRNRG